MNTSTETKPRIQSIDLLRGLVMVIMALDHCRDFFHFDSINGQNPLDFKTTNTALFLTRWITHFCAPVFVFLAGTSIFFVKQKRSLNNLSKFLLTRGLWLILLEVTIIYFGWVGNLSYAFVGLFVIWVIGLSMVLMAGLVRLPNLVLFVLGILLVFGHNLLDGFDEPINKDFSGFIWSVLHVPNFFDLNVNHGLFVGYPLMPWLGIMILGYLFGNLYKPEVTIEKRRKTLIQLGIGCIILFVLLRSGNFYGDHHPWQIQATTIFSMFSFIDTTKYPPSLLYALMTIGPAFLFLAFAEKWKNKFLNAITVFGRVPFFYYILHIYLIHAVAFIIFFASGYHLSDLNAQSIFGGFPKGFGVNLWAVYALWALVVVVLYFPCRWYNNYKSSKGYWWLSYL